MHARESAAASRRYRRRRRCHRRRHRRRYCRQSAFSAVEFKRVRLAIPRIEQISRFLITKRAQLPARTDPRVYAACLINGRDTGLIALVVCSSK